ncbi:MAG: LPS assembly lipoprotein LptE [Rubrivivax sp.]|jgi:LPS-assembly lipoprotein
MQRRQVIQGWARGAAGLVLALPLAGCGFQLQRRPALAFSRIALTGFVPRSPMKAELTEALRAQVVVVPSAAQADVLMRVREDTQQRVVVASTSASQVREIQLRLRLRFGLETGAGRPLAPDAELFIARDLSYNETQALAKEHEEAQILRDMRADIVLQVFRRLAALKL